MNKFWNFMNDKNGGLVLRIEGSIASDSFLGDENTPKEFRDELESCTGDITVWINSPGGSVFAGQQLMPPSTREVIMKSAPINEVQPLWQREAMTSGSPTIQAAIGNLPTNTITERTEKIAGTNTITNNNVIERVKEVTNNNNVTAGATERIIENNRTQELQLLSQPPVVTQPLVQVTNPDTGEVVVKALENAQLKIPFRRKLTAWGISFPVYFRCHICASKHA